MKIKRLLHFLLLLVVWYITDARLQSGGLRLSNALMLRQRSASREAVVRMLKMGLMLFYFLFCMEIRSFFQKPISHEQFPAHSRSEVRRKQPFFLWFPPCLLMA